VSISRHGMGMRRTHKSGIGIGRHARTMTADWRGSGPGSQSL
jgi:hypothetical protein